MGMGPSPGTSLGPGGPATATDGAAPQPERRCIAITAEEATLQPSGTAPATCPRNRHRKEARISPHGAGNRPGSQPEPVPARRISPRRRRLFGPQPATRMRHSSSPALAGVFRKETPPGRTADLAEPAAAPRTAQCRNPSNHTPPAAPPPRNSASTAPGNSPAAGYLSAPAASTRRNTLPRDLFRSRKRALTFADKQSYV